VRTKRRLLSVLAQELAFPLYFGVRLWTASPIWVGLPPRAMWSCSLASRVLRSRITSQHWMCSRRPQSFGRTTGFPSIY